MRESYRWFGCCWAEESVVVDTCFMLWMNNGQKQGNVFLVDQSPVIDDSHIVSN
jgi:hypothetical protein